LRVLQWSSCAPIQIKLRQTRWIICKCRSIRKQNKTPIHNKVFLLLSYWWESLQILPCTVPKCHSITTVPWECIEEFQTELLSAFRNNNSIETK
jgi:hypothetical protein